MQTFLPYPDFAKSAKCLDDKRLGKQRVECLQIMTALTNPFYGWQRHPAVCMWRGFTPLLFRYMIAICTEWENRGYRDTCITKALDLVPIEPVNKIPLWLNSKAFHRSHQSNLVRKDPIYYRKFFPKIPDNLPYVWPN